MPDTMVPSDASNSGEIHKLMAHHSIVSMIVATNQGHDEVQFLQGTPSTRPPALAFPVVQVR